VTDREDLMIMLARADNITERWIDRFNKDLWTVQETDYARKLIAQLATAVRELMPEDDG
jgi:hypothetical protein